MRRKALSVLIILLGFSVYANSLNGEFIWDDYVLIKNNAYIKDFSNAGKLFTQDITKGAGQESSAYRPLQMLTYMIDYQLWKLNVRGFHLTNILLHIIAALLIYLLFNYLCGEELVSFLAAAFFVVHPVQTGAVAYISGRADSLSLFFMLSCFLFYMRSLRLNDSGPFYLSGGIFYILALLSYILALFSRESSLILPALLLIYHYSFRIRIRAGRFLPVLFVTILYILLRIWVIKGTLPHTTSPVTLFQRLPGFFVAITSYIRLLFLPFDLHMEYGLKKFSLTDPMAISGILILSLLLGYAFRKRKADNLVFFSISWFFIALLPVSNLYPINAYMAEHWLYLPSVGFFLLMAKVLSSVFRSKIKPLKFFSLILAVALLIFYSNLTIKQNNYWRQALVFYNRTLKYAPNSARTYLNLGNAYIGMEKIEQARRSFEKAIELDPDYAEAYYNLGNTYFDMDEKRKAIKWFKKATGLNPEYADAYYNLGIAYRDTGKREQAINSFRKATEVNPDYADAYFNLGILFSEAGRKKEAVLSYRKAIEIEPNYSQAYNNLGNLYSSIGKKAEAIRSYKKALEINPNYADTYYNLGKAFIDLGMMEQAIAAYKQVIEIDPGYARAFFNLSVCYFHRQEYSLAVEYCDRAVGLGYKVNPEFLKELEAHRK